jgi:hypothetical protein
MAPRIEELTPTPEWEWTEFRDWFMGQWEQGQHVTCIGRTGSGKTATMREFLPMRNYCVAFGVKGRDDTMDRFLDDGWLRVRKWNSEIHHVARYVCLWPEILGVDDENMQRDVFRQAMNSIFRSGGWAVFMDEVSYLADTLRLDRELKFLLNQGRSSGISIVAATQRPAFIPLAFYDQATHLFVWRENDHRNVKRISELFGADAPIIAREIPQLDREARELMYLNVDTGFRVKTKVKL